MKTIFYTLGLLSLVTAPELHANEKLKDSQTIYSVSLADIQVEKQAEESKSKEHYSGWAAAGLNLILPSSGFFYSGSSGWAIAELAILGAGVGLMAYGGSKSDAGNERCKRNGGGECYDGLDGLGEAVLGSLIFTTGWVGGVVIAPIVAINKNDKMDEQTQVKNADDYGVKVSMNF